MPGPRSGKRTRATPGPPPDGQAASARNAAPVAGDRGAPKPQETRSGTGRRRAERGASGRPEVPFPYWGECMTGFEYQLAVLLIDYGYPEEATKVAKVRMLL